MGNMCNCNNLIGKKEGSLLEARIKTIICEQDESTEDPEQSETAAQMCFIDSYNAFNNFFYHIKHITKIQRAYKKYSQKKAEKNKDKEIQIGNFEKSFKVSSTVGSTSPIKIKVEDEVEVDEGRPLTRKSSMGCSLAGSVRSGDNLDTSMKGFFLNKKKKYRYYGSVVDGKKEGVGMVKWEDGSKIIGRFKENNIYGICSFHDVSGSAFEGQYIKSRPIGYGVYKHRDGATFEGTWENFYQNGIGTEIWPDDTYYQGEFVECKKHGIGTYRWKDGTLYEGTWDHNQMTGMVYYLLSYNSQGILYFTDDRTYMGELKNGLMHGFGEFIWPDGKRFLGYYANDNKHGFGAFIWSVNPLQAFIGFWEKGKQHGVGIKASQRNIKYGVWKEGKKEFWLQGSWEMKRYAKPDQFKYLKFLSREVKEILGSVA